MAKETKNRRERGNSKGKQSQLSDEAAERARSEILYGVGYKRPPEHTRFKKGQSGNPKGRPSLRDLGGGNRSVDEIVIKEAERLITVRENGEVRKIPQTHALVQMQMTTALKGSAYAQKHSLERIERAYNEQRRRIAKEILSAEQYVAVKSREITEAEHNGEPPPNPLPHPDDVIIHPELGVRIVGPINEEEADNLAATCKIRDLLIVQDALDRRQAPATVDGSPEDGPGTALLLAQILNTTVPDRFKLNDVQTARMMMRFAGLPKRQLLKELHQRWRGLRVSVPRGTVMPPLRVGQQWLCLLADLQSALRGQQIDSVGREDLEAIVSDALSAQR